MRRLEADLLEEVLDVFATEYPVLNCKINVAIPFRTDTKAACDAMFFSCGQCNEFFKLKFRDTSTTLV